MHFTTKIKKEQLENLVKGLSNQVLELIAENQELKTKIEHLETLLQNAPVQLISAGSGVNKRDLE